MKAAHPMASLPGVSALQERWRRWFYGDMAVDVETEHLRSLFGNYVSSSPGSLIASSSLFLAAPVLPAGPSLGIWVGCHVIYHLIRAAVGLAYMRRTSLGARELRRWATVSFLLQLVGGLFMLVLALTIYPQLEFMAQAVLLMVSFIVVGATSTTLAGRWATILVYTVPTYFGLAWATWPLDHDYAKPMAVLSVMFFFLYLFQARTQHRTNVRSYALARRNGELARELQVKNAELQEVATARSRLLATVSHDLRQPSHAIGLLCERAMFETSPAQLRETLGDLNELSQSLGASLTTLMDLTRLDAGLVRANLGPVPLQQVLLRLEAEFAASARNKGLGLGVPASALWVQSDPVLLHGVLANLVSNAIKYTRSGQVSVELQEEAGSVTVSVRDTGMGIKPEKFELIFKEFVRLEGAESGTEGLGLGLSIVKRYALLLGHAVTVQSQPQQGSCFSIRLPLLALQPGQAEALAVSRSAAQGDARLAGMRLLVVDNVDLVLSSMVRTLSAWGCEVHTARSLSEALEVANRHPLDLLVSDFHLGDGEPNGLALIQALRSIPRPGPRLPAILMTGDVSGQLETEASANDVAILHKPVRPAVLQDRLLGLLRLAPLSLAPAADAPSQGLCERALNFATHARAAADEAKPVKPGQ